MEHYLLFLRIFILTVGISLNFYFYTLYRDGNKRLVIAILFFLLFNNLNAVSGFWASYNVLNIYHSSYLIPRYQNDILWFFRLLFNTGILYFFILILFEIFEKTISRLFERIFIICIAIWSVLHAGNIIHYHFSFGFLYISSHMYTNLLSACIILISLVYAFYYNTSKKHFNNINVINVFIIIYFFGYLFVFINITSKNYSLFAGLLNQFYFYIALLFWYWGFYLKAQKESISCVNIELISIIKHKFGISKREEDVLTLVLQGKNPKEIENILFISYNTVRNHISTLYKKLGIKSRSQLTNLIIKLQNEK